MDTVETQTSSFYTRFQQFITALWDTLRQPQTTGVCLAVVVLVLVIGGLLPQQVSPETTSSEWIATLPTWIQPWGPPLYWLGLSRVFQTLWFWLPVALLLLSCGVALADYGPLCRRRATEIPTDIAWQHPLAGRVEESVRLPAAPDEFLDKLKAALVTHHFAIDEQVDEDDRSVSASARRANWWLVLALYSGLVVLCIAFIVSYFTLEAETITLQPFRTTSSRLFDGAFEWHRSSADGSAHGLMFIPSGDGASRSISRQLSRPVLFERAFLVPTASEPVLTVTVADETGELRRLLPLRTELSPATHLNLPVGNPDEPLFFLLPNDHLLFQILPSAVVDDNMINLQVGIEGEAEPLENRMLPVGEPLELQDFTVTILLNQQVTVTIWRDWAVPLYVVSLATIITGGVLLTFRPPWHIWLIPEVKGRGGQLYGVVEKFGTSSNEAVQFLEHLLNSESSPQTPLESKADDLPKQKNDKG
ncbi:MAG: cytochrome c biogenesis protein ResB [Anaerolineae bacterium]|nr:cytochrome c biogenesis protein ResB [Anaerolineae bacterium]